MSEHIIFAAIRRDDNCIIFGRDHAECITISPKETCKSSRSQGFLTNKYRFVLRREAAKLAYDAGQISTWENGQILISEEIWKDNPKYTYDSRRGYVHENKDLMESNNE